MTLELERKQFEFEKERFEFEKNKQKEVELSLRNKENELNKRLGLLQMEFDMYKKECELEKRDLKSQFELKEIEFKLQKRQFECEKNEFEFQKEQFWVGEQNNAGTLRTNLINSQIESSELLAFQDNGSGFFGDLMEDIISTNNNTTAPLLSHFITPHVKQFSFLAAEILNKYSKLDDDKNEILKQICTQIFTQLNFVKNSGEVLTEKAQKCLELENKIGSKRNELICLESSRNIDLNLIYKRYIDTYIKAYGGINKKDANGKIPLHYSCELLSLTPIETYKYLIEKGSTLNSRTGGGDKNTPLHLILQHFKRSDDINVVMYFLGLNSGGVVVKSVDNEINTIGDLDYTQRNGYNNTVLHTACENINNIPLEVFKILIEVKQIDIDDVNLDKNTPIHVAFSNFNNFGKGFPPHNDKNNNTNNNNNNNNTTNNTNLKKNTPTITYSKKKSKRANQRNEEDYYSNDGVENSPDLNCQVVQVVQVDDKNVNTIHNIHTSPIDDNNNNNPQSDINILFYLLNQASIKVNQRNNKGETILHTLCQNISHIPLKSFVKMLKLLILDNNANIHIKDTSYKTPYQYILNHYNITTPNNYNYYSYTYYDDNYDSTDDDLINMIHYLFSPRNGSIGSNYTELTS
jgi:hypothetical protein